MQRIHAGYLSLLDRAVARPRTDRRASPWPSSLGAAALVPFVGTEFMPALDEGAIAINVVRLPNASLQGSVEVARYLEKRLKAFPEVDDGGLEDRPRRDLRGPDGPGADRRLRHAEAAADASAARRSRAELAAAMQQDLSGIPGLRFSFSQPIALRVNELISGVKSDLAVKVFGTDLALLKGFADRIAVAVGGRPRRHRREGRAGLRALPVRRGHRPARRRRATASPSATSTTPSSRPSRASAPPPLIEDQRRFAVVVRFPPESRSDIERRRPPARRRARAASGCRSPSSPGWSSSRRRRRSRARTGSRRVVVEANIRGRDLGGFVAEVQERLAPFEEELPPGTFLELGGQFENQQRAMRTLAVVVPVALALDPPAPLPGARLVRRRAARPPQPPVRAGRRRGRGRALPDAGLGLGRRGLHRAARRSPSRTAWSWWPSCASCATRGARSPRRSARGATSGSGRSS